MEDIEKDQEGDSVILILFIEGDLRTFFLMAAPLTGARYSGRAIHHKPWHGDKDAWSHLLASLSRLNNQLQDEPSPIAYYYYIRMQIGT